MRTWLGWMAFVVIGGCSGLLAQGMKTQEQMHSRVVALYSFSPAKVTDAERTAKSAEMDAFWNDVKNNQAEAMPFLRVELKNSSNPAFFMQDGSALLLSLSKTKDDEALAAEAISHADLSDVLPSTYFYEVHELSMDGVDTTKAALHILDKPNFHVNVPAHAMTLDMGSCLLYLLVPVRQDMWIDPARSRFRTEKNETAQKGLLMLFFFSQTKEGDAAIEVAAHDSSLSKGVRDDAEQWLKNAKDSLGMKTDLKGNETAIREARRQRLGAVSDEAMDDIQQMTVRLVQLRHGQ